MKALLLSLGHNSSAIQINDNEVVSGFETERITKKKSDSSFPSWSLHDKHNVVYVSHWQPFNQLAWMDHKHWQPELIKAPVISLSPEFTHHDAHAWSALLFAGGDFPVDRTWIIVMDGFGNYGEHLSLYKLVDGIPHLAKRFHGYDTSLGLLYQYTTAFLGMKMHEDEYKILGYEAHIDQVPVDMQTLDRLISSYCDRLISRMETSSLAKTRMLADPLVSIGALTSVQLSISDHWTSVCKILEIDDPTSWRGRVIISYFVQRVLELVLNYIIQETGAENLILAGGVFYNVKANMIASQSILGKTCIMPLAGDQGATLGLYYYHNRDFVMPKHLTWGLRPELHGAGAHRTDIPGLEFHKPLSAAGRISDLLDQFGMVNVVKGNMEFGPRALCNTSTIAKADDMEIVNHINEINGRNTVMPFAPVMMRDTYESIFDYTDKVYKSEKYMITAVPYKPGFGEQYQGAAHKYVLDGAELYTGRPQVLDPHDDWLMETVLEEHKVLINTSFNVHGVPIVHTVDDVIKSHMHQYKSDPSVVTIVVTQ